MNDTGQSFEIVLMNGPPKKCLSVYSGTKTINKPKYTHKDVISNVSTQVNAIQVADSLMTNKKNNSKFSAYLNESKFFSVTELPNNENVQKKATKFDTQCVSNTQLIQMIEDAEITDAHHGISQEFDTTFTNINSDKCTEKNSLVDNNTTQLNINNSEINLSIDAPCSSVYNEAKDMDDIEVNSQTAANTFLSKNVQNVLIDNKDYQFRNQCGNRDDNNKARNTNSNVKTVKVNCDDGAVKNSSTVAAVAVENCLKNTDKHGNKLFTYEVIKMDSDENIQMAHSQILCSNFLCRAVEDDSTRPYSPILCKENSTLNSNLLAPLVFNLDKFERFESIVIPVIQSHDFETAKHVINSQILNKELHLKINEDIELTKRKISGSIVQETANSTFVLSNTGTTRLKDDNTYVDVKPSSTSQKKISTEPFQDELLFSSDEEDPCADKALPFTCALKSSFCDETDIQRKTMFVGFQTASNKSIQVSTDAFAIAERLLNDMSDKIDTDSELKNSENTNFMQQKPDRVKSTTTLGKVKNENIIDTAPELNKNSIIPQKLDKKIYNISNLQKLALSHDYDMNKKYVLDEQIVNKISGQTKPSDSHKLQNITNIGVLEVIDDDIVQEFENIEMSLDDKKGKVKTVTPKITKKKDSSLIYEFNNDMSLIVPGNENIETEKQTIKNIDSVDFCKNVFQMSASKDFIGFRTANNKNIKIGAQAWVKTKNIFNDFNSTDLTNESKQYCLQRDPQADLIDNNQSDSKILVNSKKSSDYRNKKLKAKNLYPNKIYDNDDVSIHVETINKVNTDITCENSEINNRKRASVLGTEKFKPLDFVKDNNKFETECTPFPSDKQVSMDDFTKSGYPGFQTARNQQIKVSAKALANSRKMFQNIDIFDDENKSSMKPIYPEELYQYDEMHIQNTETLKEESMNITPRFTGSHTTSKKSVSISISALEKRKVHNMEDKGRKLVLSNESNNILKQNNVENSKCLDFVKDTNKSKLVPISLECKGLPTENNQPVTVSINSLEKSRQIIEDTQSSLDNHISKTVFTKSQFSGFQTASNKQIKISAKALADSRKMLQNIDIFDGENNNVKMKPLYPEEIYQYDEMHIQNTDTLNKENMNIRPKFTGFQTASKKTVSVSKSSLEKSKVLFQNKEDKGRKLLKANENDHVLKPDNVEDSKLLDFVGYNNKLETVPISQEFNGFQTGHHQPVTVSVKSLEKDKNIFEDQSSLDNQISKGVFSKCEFSGFQTAGNKQIKVSAKALADSKKILENIDIFDGENKNIKTKSLYPEKIYQYDDMNSSDINILKKGSMEISPKFKGFHTASRKPVAVSKSAIEKSEKIFQDIIDNNKIDFKFSHDNNIENKAAKFTDKLQELHKKTENFNVNSQSGNHNTADVICTAKYIEPIEMECERNKTSKTNESNVIHETNVDNLIDTQIMNQFHEELHSEDFHDTPMKSKRSGSPILSCPRAKKKKKFEVPYNLKNVTKVVPSPLNANKETSIIIYRENYKKSKRYTLKYFRDITRDSYTPIDPYLFNFKYDTLLQFEFNKDRNNLTCGNMSIDLLKNHFLNTVDTKLVPNGWLDNHIKLILWKLISYEVKFKNSVCTSKNLLEQLKYRYDKELYNAERPALRKILEKDDVPSKTIVLCVVQIYVNGETVSSVSDTDSNIELLVTDGWYCIYCSIDRMLTELVCSNKITVGSKFATSGAELVACEHGISPWEDTSAVRLKIFGNSTRRARWDARLGYCAKSPIISDLACVKILGGKVSKLRLFVTRVYPALYVEKFEDGSTVTRSERLENLHQIKTETERQALMERLCEDIEKEFVDQDSEDSERLSDSLKRTCLDSGSQIAKMMKTSRDPGEFSAHLTDSQVRRLQDHTSKKRDKLLESVQAMLKKRIEEAGAGFNRNVICLLKIRIAGVRAKDDRVEVTKGMMSIWKPNEVVREMITEGSWIDVMNVVPTAIRYGDIQISAGRQTVFSPCQYRLSEKFKPHINVLHRQCYSIKELVQNPARSTDYNEIDTVGLIFQIDPPNDTFDLAKQQFQNVHLSDTDCNIICINFWGGIKKYGFQNFFDIGQVVVCVNLQKRAGNTRKNIPHFRVTEFSYFTLSPRNEDARRISEELNKAFSNLDRRKFCSDCVLLKNNYTLMKKNNENISPYNPYNCSVNLSRNKIFIDSPRDNSTVQNNFNLTGLDFESTFKQDTQLSEEVLKRKRKVNEKIAKLKMYGEPPPLSPINITNRSRNASNMYKSPVNLNKIIEPDTLKNVANVENTSLNCSKIDGEISDSAVTASPTLNRTYVKRMKPVKINFNNDHFVEDFDSSPPLSLD